MRRTTSSARPLLAAAVLALFCSAARAQPPAQPGSVRFQRGDADGRSGLDLADAVAVVEAALRGRRLACVDAADVDDDGALGVTDAIALLDHLFRGGPPPAPPFGACGEDPTPDALECLASAACGEAAGDPAIGADALTSRIAIRESRALPGGGERGRAAALLELGETAGGDILDGEQVDTYAFEAPRGQWVVADRTAAADAAAVNWTITDRWGRVVAGNTTAMDDLGPVALLGGLYTVTVRSEGSAAGAYEFRIVDATPRSETIAIGDTVTSALDAEHPGRRDVFLFAAAAGQSILLDVAPGVSASLQWMLEDERDNVLVTRRRMNDLGPLALAGGAYRLTVDSNQSSGNFVSGPYEFRLFGVPAPSEGTLVIGETVSGDIAEPGGADVWAFDAEPGQVVYVDVVSSSNAGLLNLEIVDALGLDVVARTRTLVDAGPMPLLGGSYTLRVLGGDTGTATYALRLVDATPSSAPIAIGAEISDAIPAGRPGQVKVYEFTSPAARLITIEHLESSNRTRLDWLLEDAHGRAVLPRTTSLDTTAPLALLGGDYRLSVLGENDQTGTYRFRLRDDGPASPAPTGDPVAVGDEVEGAVTTPGGEARFTFAATEGQSIYLDVLQESNDLDWELVDALGTSFGAARANSTDTSDRGPYALPVGDFTVVLSARSATVTPAMRFRIVDAPRTVSDTVLDATVSGSFAGAPGAVHEYRFDVDAGERVFIDRLIASSRLELSLIDPVGRVVFGPTRGDGVDNDHGPFTLAAGAYTLVVDPQYGFEPSYEIAVRRVEDAAADVALGAPITGSFAGRAGAQDTFRVTVADGQRVFVDRHAMTGRLEWTLLDPHGGAVFGPTRADTGDGDQGPFTLAAGTYTLVLDPYAGVEPSYDLRIEAVDDAVAPVVFGATASATLGPGATASYEFDAFEGQRVFFDLIAGASTLRWSLVDELGEVVVPEATASNAANDIGPLDLAAGRYTLLLDATAGNTPSYELAAWNIGVDLAVEDVEVSPRTVFKGDAERELTVSWSVVNRGGGPAPTGAWVDRLTVSTDATLGNEDDVALGDFVRFDTLAPRSSYTRRETVHLPASIPPGQYRLFLTVDADGAHNEPGGEGDNVFPVEVAVVDDLAPVEPEFITTTTFPLDFTATASGVFVDLPLDRPVALDAVRFVHVEAMRVQLTANGATSSDLTLVLLNGRQELIEIGTASPSSGAGFLTSVLRFTRRLTPELVALLPTRTTDGIRIRFSQTSNARTEIRSVYADGRLRVRFPGCEFFPCGPHLERRSPQEESITLAGAGVSEWRVITFDEGVPGDALRYVSGPRFSGTATTPPFGLPPTTSSEAQLILDDGSLVTLDDSRSPSSLANPLVSLSTSHSLGLENDELAGRQIIGFQWRVHASGFGSYTSIYEPADDFSMRFLYEVDACRGVVDIPPVELTPADGAAFPPGSTVTISGRALAPSAGRPLSAVLVNGAPVDSLDAAGRFFKTVTVADGENLFVVEVVEPGCGSHETLLRLLGLTGGASGLDGYGEVSAELAVEYADTTFSRAAGALVVRARARNVSDHAVRGPILMAITGMEHPSVTLRAPAGLTGDGDPFVVLLEGGALEPDDASPYTTLVFSNPERLPVRYGVRWLAPSNRAPEFASAPPTAAVVGTRYRYVPAAIDPDGDAVVLELLRAPAGMSLETSGVIEWTPEPSDRGTHDVELAADDGHGGRASQRFTLTVGDATPNRPPYFTSAPVTGASVGARYEYGTEAVDADGDTVSYALLAGPAGLGIDGASGLVTWSFATPGEHAVSLEASDGAGGTAVQGFVLAVGSLPSNPSAPRLVSAPPTAARVGVLYVYQPVASDPDGDALEFTLEASPSGMTIDPVRGRVEWTPDAGQTGSHPVELVVRDGRGGETRQRYAVAVDVAGANLPPVVESVPELFALAGVVYSYTVEAVDPEGDVVSFRLANGPAGMTLDETTGELEWTPSAGDAERALVAIDAVDARGGVGRQGFELTVRLSNAAPLVTAAPPPAVIVAGSVYQSDVNASDVDGDLVRYELAAGPTGVVVQPVTGLMTWRTGPADVGAHDIVVRVVDCCGGRVETTIAIEVVPDDTPPVVAVGMSANPIDVAAFVELQALASDDIAVTSRTLTVECAPDPPRALDLDALGRADFALPRPGYCIVTVTASDPSGNMSSAQAVLQVGDPDDPLDAFPPVVDVLTPAPGEVINAPADIVATISDATAAGEPGSVPLSWTVELAPAGTDAFELIGAGDGAVTNVRLAILDPTLKPNGAYRLRIVANDGVQTGGVELEVHIAGELKLGNFTVAFNDLDVPLAGVPISITRRYDTLDTRPGEFGAAWTLVAAGKVEDNPSESRTGDGLTDLLATQPFANGTRVVVTRPDGRRVGFTFKPISHGGLLSMFFSSSFEPDHGVRDTLEVVEPAGSFFMVGGTASQVGVPYNPSRYRLTTVEGVQFTIDEDDGLVLVEDRAGNTIEARENGFFSSQGVSVQFVRDAEGRIEEVVDPQGGRIRYEYDASGDLTGVTDQTGLVTRFTYRSDRPHYLEEIIDPRERSFVRVDYDPEGRLSSVGGDDGSSTARSYDVSRLVETLSDALGNVVTIVRDERGNIVSITDPNGATATAEYDDAGNLVRSTNARGFAVTRTWDERGNQTSKTDPHGNTRTYEWNELDLVTRSTDEMGNTRRYEYDAQGNVTAIIDPLGQRSTLEFDASGRLTAATGPGGLTTRYEYGSGQSPTRIVQPDGAEVSMEYNAFGQLTRYVDPAGNEVSYTYDAAGRMLVHRDPAGNETTYEYDGELVSSRTDSLGRVSRFVHDDLGRLVQEIDPLGNVSGVEYDGNGHIVASTAPDGAVTRFEWLNDGNLGSKSVQPGGGDGGGQALAYLGSWEYDAAGNRTAWTDPNGNIWRTEYDELDRPVREIDPLGGEVRTEYNAVGDRIALVEENGGVTTFEYDGLHRLLREVDPTGGVTSYEYDAEDRLVKETDPNGEFVTLEYDDAGRLVRQSRSDGSFTEFGWDAVGNMLTRTDELGRTATCTYDALGRVVNSTAPDGSCIALTYDTAGNVLTRTDDLGRVTRFTYDALDRVIAIEDAAGGVTRSTYDEVGNRVTIEDRVGNVTTFTYDLQRRLIAKTDPLGHATSYAYDASGNLVETVDRNGAARRFRFDALDRRVEETWWTGADLARTIAYEFDARGNVTSVSDPSASYAFEYDALDRPTRITNAGTPAVPELELRHTWDAHGNKLSTSDDLGVRVDSTYTGRDKLLTRAWTGLASGPLELVLGYDVSGRRTTLERFLGANRAALVLSTERTHGPNGLVDSITHTDGAGRVVSSFEYEYDAIGRLASERRGARRLDYSYDALDQLVGVEYDGFLAERYEYDDGGNRDGLGWETLADNRLRQDGSWDYEYDLEGQLVAKTGRGTGERHAYGYDHRHRLVRVDVTDAAGTPTSTVEFVYDPLDRRIGRTVDGQASYTIHDEGQPWADVDAGGAVVARYLLTHAVDEMAARHTPGAGFELYLADRLGTVHERVDTSGAETAGLEYDAFGRIIASRGEPDRFAFTGREFDSETGLYSYRARYYDPSAGRFVSQDPVDFRAGDTNLYRYVGNSPLNGSDPTGLVTASGNYARLASTMASAILSGVVRGTTTRALSVAVQAGPGAALAATAIGTPLQLEAISQIHGEAHGIGRGIVHSLGLLAVTIPVLQPILEVGEPGSLATASKAAAIPVGKSAGATLSAAGAAASATQLTTDSAPKNKCRPILRPNPIIPDGDAKTGWEHILGRHLTGNLLDSEGASGDLFCELAKDLASAREALADIARDIVRRGNPLRRKGSQFQGFRGKARKKVPSCKPDGTGVTRRPRIVVWIHTLTGEVTTIYPEISGPKQP